MSDRRLSPDELGPRLMEVYDLVGPLYRRVHRKVEHTAPLDGLTVGTRAVLVLLAAHGPMTVPQMGRAQALSRQFAQRMANEAAAGGLVEAVPNPAHKRSPLFRLTAAGRRTAQAVNDRENALLQEAAGLTDAEVAACTKVLGRMLALLDNVDVDAAAPGGADS